MGIDMEMICNVIRAENIGFKITQMCETITEHYTTPSALMKPKIFIDGNKWCALCGDNLQNGLCGFGDTPAEAITDFNKNYFVQKVDKG